MLQDVFLGKLIVAHLVEICLDFMENFVSTKVLLSNGTYYKNLTIF
jgi:hypothetical protein